MDKSKKLYRKNEGKMLLGVCAGLADYLAMDPTVVRLLWVLFTCVGGSGILAYIVCAIIMPVEGGLLITIKIF